MWSYWLAQSAAQKNFMWFDGLEAAQGLMPSQQKKQEERIIIYAGHCLKGSWDGWLFSVSEVLGSSRGLGFGVMIDVYMKQQKESRDQWEWSEV